MRARKVDANHALVRDGLRDAGFSVLDLSAVGKGCPDLLVGLPCGANLLFEIKRPWVKGIAKADLELTPDQVEFFESWIGHRAKVTTTDEALQMIAAHTCRQNL